MISKLHRNWALALSAAAAFSTYFCMYAFRKPFSAGTFEGEELWGLGLKSVLITSQLLGYILSKFIGIKVVSEMPAKYRAFGILALIAFAEVALVGFAYAPNSLRVVCLFLNGLPLGMVFGLVLGYLEGRRYTEALTAVLCASFIMSSGVVKSAGRWLIEDWGVSEFSMPMVVGLLFALPLLLSVWLLSQTPPADEKDQQLRAARTEMTGRQRWDFFRAYWPGLVLLLCVYIVLTVLRTLRDDFGVEIWQAMGTKGQPEVYAQSETAVAVIVTVICGMMIWVTDNLNAIRLMLGMMGLAFGLTVLAAFGEVSQAISPMVFMVLCGIGLYLPYVAFHTCLFERLIALARRPSNLGFLMYLADSVGYLGYSAVLLIAPQITGSGQVLNAFRWSLYIGAGGSALLLVAVMIYFHQKFGVQGSTENDDLGALAVQET
jgi:hypothetical protein